MEIVENASLTTRSSMRTGGTARFAATITHTKDIVALHAFAQAHNLPLYIFGEGTNTLFDNKPLELVAGFMHTKGIHIDEDTDTYTRITVAAGETWDDVVAWAVAKNLYGIEALSLIPGTAGAAPIQNIGAYGSEFKDTCHSVTVYDTTTKTIHTMPPASCSFGYRDSLFKQQPGRFIVTEVTLTLHKGIPPIPTYADIQSYTQTHPLNTVADIRNAIIHIRTQKLPNYHHVPNVGSFFKNPIITTDMFKKMTRARPDIPHKAQDDGTIKVFAGWLIEQVGLKGKEVSGIVIHHNNALILTNPHTLPYSAVRDAEQHIVHEVYSHFGIRLEREPILITTP